MDGVMRRRESWGLPGNADSGYGTRAGRPTLAAACAPARCPDRGIRPEHPPLHAPQDTHWPDCWTAVTKDGLPSAQFEHTMVVTETGIENLTARRGGRPPLASTLARQFAASPPA